MEENNDNMTNTEYPDIRIRKVLDQSGKLDWFEVIQDCIVQEYNVTIPAYYITDFSSVPRILWSIIPPYGRATAPSILHDYMYTTKLFSAGYGDRPSRALADNIFYENMLIVGVPKWQAKCMFWAVRIFGKSRYGNDDRPTLNNK